MKRVSLLVFVFLFVFSSFPETVRADIGSGIGSGAEIGSGVTGTYRRDEHYADVQPGDIDIWDNGAGISISGGGQTYSVNYRSDGSEYAALISKYLDTDGEYTVQVDIYLHRGNVLALNTGTSYNADDGSVYNRVYIRGTSGFAWQGEYHRVLLRGGLFKATDGSWTENPSYNYFDNIVSSSPGYLGDVYSSPFFGGKYLVYSSYEYRDESSPKYVGFPVNLLPNAPLGAGTTNIPYRTTFRMLTGETTVYNKFYYTSSYMSGADEISASGTIRLDATKLVDGSVTRTCPSAPQILCQKSTYGTVYDIVSTNDDNLLSLLGISKPTEKYWDVSAQEWKNVSSGGTNPPAITPEPGINFIPDSKASVLENFLGWLEYRGYPVVSDVAFLFDAAGLSKLDAIEDFSVLLSDYLGLYTYNATVGKFGFIGDGASEEWRRLPESPVVDAVRKEFTDRFTYNEAKDSYTWAATKLASAGVAGINAGLGVGALGTGGTGNTGSTGGNTGGNTGGGDTTLGDGVANGINGVAAMVKDIVDAFKQLLANIGEMGSVVQVLFGFLPPEMIGFIRITVYGCLFVAFYKAVRG